MPHCAFKKLKQQTYNVAQACCVSWRAQRQGVDNIGSVHAAIIRVQTEVSKCEGPGKNPK